MTAFIESVVEEAALVWLSERRIAGSARVIDFEIAANNDWPAVNQFERAAA